MSSSPTGDLASHQDLRETIQTIVPPTTAEVRSAAVAKLKRAASLPRTPAGQRAQPARVVDADAQSLEQHSPAPSSLTPTYPSIAQHVTSPSPSDIQEVLSPSPVQQHFDHAAIYASPPPSALSMQRSASAASSYHMPTPTHLGAFSPITSPYYAASPGHTPDWAAMQLAHSYLPSLSPVGIQPPPFSQQLHPGGGRNTPSPLPSLGELRTLQRSNSAMARAHAMSKLTGGRNTPSDEDQQPHVSQGGLTRAGTLNPSKMMGANQPEREVLQDTNVEETASRRPRLQRSFTVSSSNMGEERRSAVGRRMVARLGERKAARRQEEEEVRRLWEEKRATAGQNDEADMEHDGSHRDSYGEGHHEGTSQRYPGQENAQERYHTGEMSNGYHQGQERGIPQDTLPTSETASPTQRSMTEFSHPMSDSTLGVPDRPISRNTMRSEAFEYDNLRRSLSSRTACKEMGIVEGNPKVDHASNASEAGGDDEEEISSPSIQQALEQPLPLPRPPFVTPSRHVAHASTSTDSTIQGHSPGDSIASRDALGSMMFVMGGHMPTPGSGKSGEQWPSEVEDHSSDWGTPARDLHQPTFAESPLIRSPMINPAATIPHVYQDASSPHYSPMDSQGEYTPPGASQRTSVMSWEEVGGPEDQAVPSDTHYHKKSGSISAKLGRKISTAMRKRSQSRSSVSSSTEGIPTSPKGLAVAIQNFSRRGSEASLSPSQASAVRSVVRGSPHVPGDYVKHQPSISSFSPSVPGQPGSSANSILLQHQLSGEPSPVGIIPRADLKDPRIHSSKLSPFPGIVNLDRKGDSTPLSPPLDVPKLLHQNSDSAVPSQQRTSGDPVGPESIYSLPLPTTTVESRRASDDSVGKRSWLAKAFGQQTSPRSSGGMTSRSNSGNDLASVVTSKVTRKVSIDHGMIEPDPFAGPAAPVAVKPSRHRSASPSVSIVPEVSEEGSRLTRFTAHTRLDNASPAIPEENHVEQSSLPEKSKEILSRMDELLGMGPDDPARPDILDDPPRKLLLATQILQVVNVHTAKDRFLFLFNDILVITKPLITQGVTASLDTKFLVKSVVSLDKLQISGFEDETTTEPPQHAVVQRFIAQFAEDPFEACKFLVERSNPRVDSTTLASVIFKTPELDRAQIGVLLAGNDRLMRAFIDRFHFSGIRIDDALRMFLLAVRLPGDPTAAETLLRGFAHRYFEANRDVISFSKELAEDLVLWIMQLNDTLYGMYGFALPNHAITLDVVISAFQSKDPHHLVHPSLLSDIYGSLKRSPLDQALTAEEESLHGREVALIPSKIPSKLTYNTWSDPIRIKIPTKDEGFTIKLIGAGLDFDPPILSFASSNEAFFKVKGVSLGAKSILFDRSGPNAALYARLGNTRTFTVERAFMQHTFQVSFISHLGLKRKYCFSVADASTRTKWGNMLQKQISATTSSKRVTITDTRDKIRHAAEVVSLQVLRDALIPPESKLEEHNRSLDRPAGPPRMGSISLTYPMNQGRAESELGPLVPGRPGPRGDAENGMVECKNGKELVLLCRQNSLLPGVLELLQAGLPTTTPSTHVNGMHPILARERAKEAKEVVLGPGVGGGGGGLDRSMSSRVGGGRI